MSNNESKFRSDIFIFTLIILIFGGLIIASTFQRYRIDNSTVDNNVSFQFYTSEKSDISTPTGNREQLININTSSVEQLESLPGIGAKKAKAIVDYRENFGNFKSISDITKVEGIGDSTFEQIKDLITVG